MSLDMTHKSIPDGLVKRVHTWLGSDGVKWFKDVKTKHGTVSAIWNKGGIPHPVHFREGMQVRNFMRSTDLCKGWDSHDYDNSWARIVEQALHL